MKRGFQTGFIALVFLLLIFPLCGGLLPEMQEDGLKENRALATFPTEGSL